MSGPRVRPGSVLRFRVLSAGCVLGGLLVGAAPGWADAAWVLSAGSEHRSWSVGTYQGDADFRQTIFPIDLAGSLGRSDVRLGLDFASSHHEDWRGEADLTGPARLRLGATTRLADGRIRLDLDAGLMLESGPFPGTETTLLGYLSDPVLPVPLDGLGEGDRIRLTASSMVLSTRRAVWLVGGFYELRSAYDLRDDGLEADPGDVLGLATGLHHLGGAASFDHSVHWEVPSTGQLDGRDAFSLGSRVRLTTAMSIPLGEGRARAGLELLGVASGEIPSDAVLDDPAVRGGNRIRWSIGWDRDAALRWGLGLNGTHQRGFAGAAGRADWVEPELRIARDLGAVRAEATVDYAVGKSREGRDLRSFGLRARLSRSFGR